MSGVILNVNDHEPTRYLVTRLLSMAGFRVIEASTGQEALLLSLQQPDLVILDIKLPDMSGLEVCRMIKGRAETASIFVLQTSATFVTWERRVAGLDSGADGYLAHPFEPAELVATVNSLLRLKAAEGVLRQRADMLLEESRRKDEFLAMLAHELRNPLGAMTSGIELLQLVHHDKSRFLQVRDLLRRQSRHLAHLIDDLLDVSRITRNHIELRRQACDVAEIVSIVIAGQEHAFQARSQTVEARCDGGLLIDADPTRLTQVVLNLLDNASKYTPVGGSIRVKAERRVHHGAPFVRLEVSDNGRGIEPAFLPRVFDLFAQADATLARTAGGLGIGLTLVKRIVEMHAGEVRALSDGAGQGSTFEVWLPLVDAARELDPERTRRIDRRRSILIAEDNVDAASALAQLLRDRGHQVRIVHEGSGAVVEAQSGSYDVALINLSLPALNGFEVASRVRQAGTRIGLIALTGFGAIEERERALLAGFQKHVLKPVEPEQLLLAIDEVGAMLDPPAFDGQDATSSA